MYKHKLELMECRSKYWLKEMYVENLVKVASDFISFPGIHIAPPSKLPNQERSRPNPDQREETAEQWNSTIVMTLIRSCISFIIQNYTFTNIMK